MCSIREITKKSVFINFTKSCCGETNAILLNIQKEKEMGMISYILAKC